MLKQIIEPLGTLTSIFIHYSFQIFPPFSQAYCFINMSSLHVITLSLALYGESNYTYQNPSPMLSHIPRASFWHYLVWAST